MGDSLRTPYPNNRLEARIIVNKKLPKSNLFASATNHFSQKTLQSVTSVKRTVLSSGAAGDVVSFLVITAALEVVRRLSKARCPFIWRGLQALQVLCYPPFKWIERWGPTKASVKQLQKLSRPMLLLSIATVFSDQSSYTGETPPNDYQDTQASSVSHLNTSPEQGSSEISSCSEALDGCHPEKWLLQLHEELRKEGITVPERLSDDELRQFYAAAKGDFAKLLSSVKKTIKWRKSYSFLSPQELKDWSQFIFWHGYDANQRPCLIICLGLACSNLKSNNRPLFVKSVVSQIEHGILRLVGVGHPRVTVLMDCEGLSPFGFPIHIMRSCAMLLQDHYPNSLSCLIIVRLPQVAQVIMQALFQVLKPATRRKVRIIGRNHQEFLSKHLSSVPSFLGGNCSCSQCLGPSNAEGITEEVTRTEPTSDHANDKSPEFHHHNGSETNANREKLIKTIVIGILMVWIFTAVTLRMHYQETLPLLHRRHDS